MGDKNDKPVVANIGIFYGTDAFVVDKEGAKVSYPWFAQYYKSDVWFAMFDK